MESAMDESNWIPIRKKREMVVFRSNREVDRIHEFYLSLVHHPCPNCRDRCLSQLEFMEHNAGLPWKYCSACDPCLVERESEYRPQNWTDADEVKRFGSVRPSPTKDPRRSLLGERLRLHRLTAGLTGAEVASALEVSPSTLSRWETELVSPPVVKLRQWARVVGLDNYWELLRDLVPLN